MLNKELMCELRQKMEVAVSTFRKLEGRMPSAEELFSWLGTEYTSLILEYSNTAA